MTFDDRYSITRKFGEIEDELAKIKFDVSEIFDSYLELENGRDSLTKLLNRRFLPTVLSREIALQKRDGAVGFALLMLDIDHFKRVNDTYGHPGGDIVLQQAAAIITNSVRHSDYIFRYGGEEILVVLVEVQPSTALQIAESIRSAVELSDFTMPSGIDIKVTVSIGVAWALGDIDYNNIISAADSALYKAKESGRNKVVSAN